MSIKIEKLRFRERWKEHSLLFLIGRYMDSLSLPTLRMAEYRDPTHFHTHTLHTGRSDPILVPPAPILKTIF